MFLISLELGKICLIWSSPFQFSFDKTYVLQHTHSTDFSMFLESSSSSSSIMLEMNKYYLGEKECLEYIMNQSITLIYKFLPHLFLIQSIDHM